MIVCTHPICVLRDLVLTQRSEECWAHPPTPPNHGVLSLLRTTSGSQCSIRINCLEQISKLDAKGGRRRRMSKEGELSKTPTITIHPSTDAMASLPGTTFALSELSRKSEGAGGTHTERKWEMKEKLSWAE